MLDSLITSKARFKLLLKFFMNPETRGYLRELATEFGESTNNIRVELNRLTKAKMLLPENVGRTIVYRANVNHPLFVDIQNVVQKYVGIDRLIDDLAAQLGQLEVVYVIGDYARGVDSGLIDLVLVGDVKPDVLDRMLKKTSHAIARNIRPMVVHIDELKKLWDQLDMEHALLIWKNQKEENTDISAES